MKSLLTLAIVAIGMPTLASATTFQLPEDKPAATITIPDGWSPKAVDNRVEANSADGSVYIAAEGVEAKEMEQLITDDIKFLSDQGIVIDKDSMKKDEGELNGMKGAQLTWAAKDKDGPTKVNLTIFGTPAGKIVLLTYWGTPEAAQKNQAELQQIITSLKPAP